MSVTITFDNPQVSPAGSGYGMLLAFSAQRGSNGKVYTGLVPWDPTDERKALDISNWLSIHANGEWHMWASVIPRTIREEIFKALAAEGPRILEERREELEAARQASRDSGASVLRRRISELEAAMAEVEAELVKYEAGDPFNAYAGRA